MMEAIALPREMQALAGRIIDCDSHEMIPLQEWENIFGEDFREIAEAYRDSSETDDIDKASSNVPGYPGDIMEITSAIADVKGCRAPGAVDIARRLDVMDAMGIHRQLMFPTSAGVWALAMMMFDKYDPNVLRLVKGDRVAKAKRWIHAYNDWMIREGMVSDRIRPVPPVLGDTVEELMENTKKLIDAGIRAILLSAGALPGGKSPAHPDLDPFWEMLVKANCVVTLHIGSEGKFLESLRGWRDAPAFDGYRFVGEFSFDPWFLSMIHLPAQNFISTMTLGGVFVRYPELRVGVIETGAYWVGPMLETLDLWHRNVGAFANNSAALKELPSTYIKRNVRVSVFPFEDLESYISHYGLEDVICFATDYPHVEGGKDVLRDVYKKVERFGPEIVEKIFVTNGQYLLPD